MMTITEFFYGAIFVLQCFVVFLAMISYSHIEDKKAWTWFILGMLTIVVRRLIGLSRFMLSVDTALIENILMAFVSLFLIKYIWEKSNRFRNGE